MTSSAGWQAINPALYKNPGFDPVKDFSPIGLVGIDLGGNKSTFEAYYDQAQSISWLADSGS